MKCDSQVSLLACTFTSLCLGREPKARVVTHERFWFVKNEGIAFCMSLEIMVYIKMRVLHFALSLEIMICKKKKVLHFPHIINNCDILNKARP
jgi:hypothetical protein